MKILIKNHQNILGNILFKKKNHHIKLRWDKKRDNYFVIICKDLEDWLLFITQNTKIDIGKLFGFKRKPNRLQLHRAILTKPKQFETLAKQLVAEQLKPILYLQQLLDQ